MIDAFGIFAHICMPGRVWSATKLQLC